MPAVPAVPAVPVGDALERAGGAHQQGLVEVPADELHRRRVPLGVKPARLKKSVDSHHGEVEEALGQRKTAQLKRLLEEFFEESARC